MDNDEIQIAGRIARYTSRRAVLGLKIPFTDVEEGYMISPSGFPDDKKGSREALERKLRDSIRSGECPESIEDEIVFNHFSSPFEEMRVKPLTQAQRDELQLVRRIGADSDDVEKAKRKLSYSLAEAFRYASEGDLQFEDHLLRARNVWCDLHEEYIDRTIEVTILDRFRENRPASNDLNDLISGINGTEMYPTGKTRVSSAHGSKDNKVYHSFSIQASRDPYRPSQNDIKVRFEEGTIENPGRILLRRDVQGVPFVEIEYSVTKQDFERLYEAISGNSSKMEMAGYIRNMVGFAPGGLNALVGEVRTQMGE